MVISEVDPPNPHQARDLSLDHIIITEMNNRETLPSRTVLEVIPLKTVENPTIPLVVGLALTHIIHPAVHIPAMINPHQLEHTLQFTDLPVIYGLRAQLSVIIVTGILSTPSLLTPVQTLSYLHIEQQIVNQHPDLTARCQADQNLDAAVNKDQVEKISERLLHRAAR